MMPTNLEFLLDGMKVGYFEAREYPARPGRYRYMPYRSGGHYKMVQQILQQGAARCYYDTGALRVSFTVIAIPEYGTLELSDLQSSSRS